ncbi:MAG: NRDE family protein [Pseudomonadota bacterium]|nr:NRDE family protein [Gallaecimonas pentaromativorans]MED5524609.1 NRDE family protein [Pseudomonadota bacterium]
MCTVVILRRPGQAWPLLIAGNRDEMNSRPWREPGRYWAEQPQVVAGQDLSAGGTWQGLNDCGLVATILNRAGTLGPQEGKLSRGELPLLALAHRDAKSAAEAISGLDARQYRPFNLLLADARHAFWIANKGEGCMLVQAVPEGLSMLTAHDLNDTRQSPRMAVNLPRFKAAEVPDPSLGDWRAWRELLAFSGEQPPNAERFDIRPDAMQISSNIGFETVSSSLIAIPGDRHKKAQWLFNGGQGYRPVLG